MTIARPTRSSDRTVAEATVTVPKLLPGTISRTELDTFFANDHVHAALLMDGRTLVTVILRDDLAKAASEREPRSLGALGCRIVHPQMSLEAAWAAMRARHQRRLAVVDRNGVLLGLLCLKRSGDGFCTDAGIASRQASLIRDMRAK